MHDDYRDYLATNPRPKPKAPRIARWFALGVLLWVAAYGCALAGDTYRWTEQNYVTIQPSSRPDVVAEVHFVNDITHTEGAETFTVDLDGLSVEVEYRMNTHGADDTLIVTPPAGYIAYPPEVTVPEGGAGTILILLEATS